MNHGLGSGLARGVKIFMNQKAKEILGDYTAFYALQRQRLQNLGIEIDGLAISHLAFRTETLAEYLVARQKLEALCAANVENTWNGNPISKLLLQEPLPLSQSATTLLIELIPGGAWDPVWSPDGTPVHQSIYKMGLEHIGIVIGEAFADFGKLHTHDITGQQVQSEFCQPYFITFSDHTNAKFYRYSLQQVCILEGKRFDGFYHELN